MGLVAVMGKRGVGGIWGVFNTRARRNQMRHGVLSSSHPIQEARGCLCVGMVIVLCLCLFFFFGMVTGQT